MRKVLKSLWRVRRAVMLYIVLILVGWALGLLVRDMTIPELRPMNESMIHNMITAALIIYVIAAAIPFVPGAEIGFGLLLMFGGAAAPMVYGAMVCALIISFLIARLVPGRYIVAALEWARLKRAAALVRDVDALPFRQRAKVIEDQLSGKLSLKLFRHRYIALALVLNLPGNTVVGGGGGLAFAAGLSGVYRFWGYALAVAVAVAPIPLIFALMM